ncbi:MAG: hypothetical protein AB1609_21145, partial [Bacillota bacterium]
MGEGSPFIEVLTPQEAKGRFFAAWQPPPVKTEKVALFEALGRVLAADVVAGEDLPPFARSTVDGYALRAADTFGAGEGLPAYLSVAGEVVIGQAPRLQIG